MARYYIIAGEASGDMHAANLMREIMVKDRHACFRFWGGDRMAELGGKPVRHINELAFMGFMEVAANLPTILRNIRFCKRDIISFSPDVLILVDYPGFNLRMAEFAHQQSFKVAYYISPQVWAWKQSRVAKIKRFVDKMLVILPFEKEFYAKHGLEVEFPGHPLLDELDRDNPEEEHVFYEINKLPQKPIVALLPGSRKQEISRMLAKMVAVADYFPDYQFVVAGVPAFGTSYYNQFFKKNNISLVYNQTYSLLRHARAALVASGTATLETALLGAPQVVCYKANRVSYFIARKLVKIKYISLVNLIMDKPLVRELIQDGFSGQTLVGELDSILHDDTIRNTMLEGYAELKIRLGGTGASARAAQCITDMIDSRP